MVDMNSNLVRHALRELQIAGLLDSDADYDGFLGLSILDIVDNFAKQNHSGGSAHMTINLLNKLLSFEPITPLTYGPEEWVEAGEGIWQNKRDGNVFSNDGGKTHYDIRDKAEMNHDTPEDSCCNDGKVANTPTPDVGSKYIDKARNIVRSYINARKEKTDDHIVLQKEDVFVVWFSKTLQNWKALVSTTLPDGMYYEITYDGNRRRAYIDAYKKWENLAVAVVDE